jgi:hypothetical protein
MPALARLARRLRLRAIAPVAMAAAVVALVGFGVVAATDPRPRTDAAKQVGADPSALGPEDYEAVPMTGDAPERSSSTGTSGGGSTTATASVSATVTDPRTYLLGSGVFLTVAPDEVPDVIADATAVARELGGYPGSSTFDVRDSRATGSADLWVPTDRFADAMARLTGLGAVERVTQSSRDISGSRAALVQQIAADRQLLERIDEAGPYDSDDDERFTQTRAAVESQLTLRRQRLANLDKRVDMTLINLRVAGKDTPPVPPKRWSLEWALDEAAHIVRATTSVVIIGLATLLVPVGLIALGWFVVATARRRRRDAALDDE